MQHGSLIDVVAKKNGKLQICVDHRKLNATTISDPFPISFTDGVLDGVAGYMMYSRYNQMRMVPVDQDKTTFVTKWGVFVAILMMFGLKTAPTSFQRAIAEIFAPFIPKFMRYFSMNLHCSERSSITYIG